jgi:anaerobic ribonucleoside-triphosphate reductase activating protein
LTVADLLCRITDQPGLEGVTFTGGEPFAQARPLANLGRLCREAGLSVVAYTGYEYGCIRRSKRTDWRGLLEVTDLLLAGPFRRDLADCSRPWVGSSNQEFVFLTDRYRLLESRLAAIPNRTELRVGAGGTVSMNGMAPEADVRGAHQALADLGVRLHNDRSVQP